jgi:hypothetical protein
LGKPLALPRFNHFGLNVLSLTKLTEIIGKLRTRIISIVSNDLWRKPPSASLTRCAEGDKSEQKRTRNRIPAFAYGFGWLQAYEL